MHDFVNNSSFSVDFKIENQKGTYAMFFEKERNVVQAHKKLSNMKKPLDCVGVRIGLLNFTI